MRNAFVVISTLGLFLIILIISCTTSTDPIPKADVSKNVIGRYVGKFMLITSNSGTNTQDTLTSIIGINIERLTNDTVQISNNDTSKLGTSFKALVYGSAHAPLFSLKPFISNSISISGISSPTYSLLPIPQTTLNSQNFSYKLLLNKSLSNPKIFSREEFTGIKQK